MSPMKITPRRTAVLDAAWLILCLLALMSALVAFTPLWTLLPALWRGALVAPGLLATLLIVVASCEPSSGSASSPTASMRQ